ncbi:unnamed protein product, partial [Tetraodon nigroviridis]
MESGSLDPPDSGLKSVRRPSPQGSGSKAKDRKKAESSLQEVKRRGRMERSRVEEEDMSAKLKMLSVSSRPSASGTGLVFSDIFTHHKNLWDSSHPESPERVTFIMEELQHQGLLSQCTRVEPREATEEELLLCHTKHHVDLLRSTQTMTEDELHSLSDKYDSVYLHPESFTAGVTAVGSLLQLVDRVMTSELRNGFAVVRPPGHHAQKDLPNGFCLFNNVAIAARYAQTRHSVSRVLIVDWDVHHGQGTQYLFQEDPSVLYFSVHRYEQGSFWPHLPESDSHFVGTPRAAGRNINLPWNKTGMTDADYISAFQQLLLPIAHEFQPQLVLVSAGFDAAVEDEKVKNTHRLRSNMPPVPVSLILQPCCCVCLCVQGEMCVRPPCFHILTHMLMALAEGRLLLALEGGYNLQSTAEAAAACVGALLGGACPPLAPPTAPSDSALQSISQTLSALFPHWPSLQTLESGPWAADGVQRTTTVDQTAEPSGLAPSVAAATGLVYDERMMEHLNLWDRHHPEQPQRIFKIFSKHQELGLVDRCQRIPARLATEEELSMCHRSGSALSVGSEPFLLPLRARIISPLGLVWPLDRRLPTSHASCVCTINPGCVHFCVCVCVRSLQHVEQMRATATMKPRDLHRLGNEFNSIYINNQSFQSALLAAGGCFSAVEQILAGQVRNAVAVVRPPGHHAERDLPCGFCFFNTAALAARHAQKLSRDAPLRVLILDWDVHHGNGTQHMFEDDDSVLYISLHRYDNGAFFPSSEDAAPDRVGVSKGAGYNVNIAWSGGRMGDPDYLAAFHHVVMPIATEVTHTHTHTHTHAHTQIVAVVVVACLHASSLQFNPGLVLVSAGFDAARGDPLGGYHVTPEGYAHLTHQLMSLAGGRVLLILEGGYNLSSISKSMAMCTSVLLGDPPPSLVTPLPPPHPSAVATINEVVRHHAPYWRSLRIHSQSPLSSSSFIVSLRFEDMFSRSVPESVRSALPSPKHRGKRSSRGKDRKSEGGGKDGSPLSPAGQLDTLVVGGFRGTLERRNRGDDACSVLWCFLNQRDGGVEVLTQGLASLDISPAAAPSPTVSAWAGGARPKAPPSPERACERDAKAESPEPSQSGGEGACGGPASHGSLELICGGPSDVSGRMSETWRSDTPAALPCPVLCPQTLYVVDPLPWCPHLDAVRPLPPSGIDIFQPCQDCGSEAENWICLTCYQVFCGRYVSEHMVTHGAAAEHPVVLSFSDLSVWCYLCEAYVHNQTLFEAKNAAHCAKFGEEIPP